MAEPSYHPLSPVKDPVEHTTSPSPEQPSTAGAVNPPGSRSSMFLAPLYPQVSRKGPSTGHPALWPRIRTPLQMALLPLAAIGYLAFCYTVHGEVVPVETYGLYTVTPQHLATIKGGITAISIIVISIALYPVYGIMSKLKSEEFFRVLTSQRDGIPLETVNYISTPTFGQVDMMLAMWRRRCSNYYTLGIVASLLVWIVATLAPGTLTIESVLSDGELMAFAIGAVPAQSVLNGTDPLSSNATANSDMAASVAWAEMELDVQYSFGIANATEPDYAAFIAPVPVDLSTTTSARWLSDVIGINPTCSWAFTNLTTPLQISSNSSAFDQYFATAYLVDFNLDVQVTADDLPSSDTTFATVKNPTEYVTNHTTQALASDGSTVFLLGQCQSGCSAFGADITLDFTGIDTTFTIALTNQTWTMAILACVPNVTVETREVRNDGHGILTVQPRPTGHQLTRQGNLNPIQTTALFSIAPMSITTSVGQLSGSFADNAQLGSQVQADILFGNSQVASLLQDVLPGTSLTLTPAPIDDITQRYTQLLQSSAKSYLAGYLGTAYVPGRISASEIVFAASIPNLAVSSAVFVLLAALIVVVNFRQGKGVEFTLVNVAAAVHGSELPGQFVQMKGERATGRYERIDEEAEEHPEKDGEGSTAAERGKVDRSEGDAAGEPQDIMETLGERHIFMQRRADGSPVLHMS